MTSRYNIRKISYQVADEEKSSFSLKMNPVERIKYLEHLRKINLGPMADLPIRKIITVIPFTLHQGK